MALNVSSLASEIQSNIEAEAGGPPSNPGELSAYCTALAQAIVDRIQGDAVVTATGADPQGGTVHSTGTVA